MKKYLKPKYLHKSRWISYWYQIQEASSLPNVKSVLEVGPGNKVVADTLTKMGYYIKTLDQDPRVSPDFVADIKKPCSLPQKHYDLVLCCQVLEHLPYPDFNKALKNLFQLTRRYLLLTLPSGAGSIRLKLPFGNKIITLPGLCSKSQKNTHYWEIGRKGYPLKRIIRDIQAQKFKILKNFFIPENPYHYLILCQKQTGYLP